jgi:pimeloyl-ACP methyl ester carboxylesterase
MTETLTFTTPDGRTLCAEVAGRRGGPAILIHQGMPNARLLFEPWIEDAERRGAFLVCYERPGYGDSTPHPGYRVADGAADTATVADALGLERFVVWGISGGGPHALACAALLPDRVAAAATIGSPAPFDADGLDYFAGMGQENADDIKLELSDPAAARRKAEADREEMLAMSDEDPGLGSETLVSNTDAAVLAGPFGRHFHRCVQSGLAPGSGGWWDDGQATITPWGFDVAQIRVPFKVWHGAQDQFVPFGHGKWLAERIPGAESSLRQEDGHLNVVAERIGEVHDWLLARLVP